MTSVCGLNYHKKCTDLFKKSGIWRPKSWNCQFCKIQTVKDISNEVIEPPAPKLSGRHRKSNILCDHPESEFLQSQINTLKSVIAMREAELKKSKESNDLKAKRIIQLEAQLNESRKVGVNLSASDNNGEDLNRIAIANLETKTADIEQKMITLLSRIDVQETSYVCEYCDDEFRTKSALKTHTSRNHARYNNERLTERICCPLCNNSFSAESYLQKHLTSYHFKCDDCSYYANHTNDLRRHKVTMHGPEINCDKCSHITRSRSDMQKHRLMRHSDNPTHVCNVCNYFAFNQEDLDSHSSTHNSVLEGFRQNTEVLCNNSGEGFSDDFINQCQEDLLIINEISSYESLQIPPITLEKMKTIVFNKLMLNKACDVYMLTTEHLRFAGDSFLDLLCTFINRLLRDSYFLSSPEFKISIASVIYKGKGKPRNHHKSYRLVRVCPLICRIIDEHIRPQAVELSRPLQSRNQYGFTENITYLMGALQRHEAQKYCVDTKRTFFGCSLDGDSAFEVVNRPIQRRELYFAGETGQLSPYNEGIYENTLTRIKMNGKLSKHLEESLGMGQGKIRSSDHYKIYINSVLETLENSGLGVDIGPINTGMSCVADDLYLLTDNQVKLQGQLDIAQHYGKTFRITYGASKTVISVVGSTKDMNYFKEITPWVINSSPVNVQEDNDHLGLIVSGVAEEQKNVDQKLKKARGALFSLLGPAFSSKCLLSPTVQLHLYRTFVSPIALSGLSAMTLRDTHLQCLTSFHKKSQDCA